MSLLLYNHTAPEVIGELDPLFFDEINQIMDDRQKSYRNSAVLMLDIYDNELVLYPDYVDEALQDHAIRLGQIILPYVTDPTSIRVDIRRHEKRPEHLFWHRDGFRKDGAAIAVSNCHTTKFAYGKHLTTDYKRAKIPRVKANKIADKLELFRPEPFEIVKFDN